MTKFEKKLIKICTAHSLVNKLDNELSVMIESHLGENWAYTYDRSDGSLLLSPDSYNYRISTYLETQDMPRDKAIEYIENNPFN